MASPVDIASIFKHKGQTSTPETQAPSRGSPIIRSFFARRAGIEETAPKAEVKELTEEKRNAAQRNKNKAFASGRPATIFSQPESSNIKIKKSTLGSGS